MRKFNVKGFTLIELMIALFIFTIISFIMANVLHHVFDIQTVTDKHSALMTRFHQTALTLERDFQQTIDRKIINANATLEPSLEGTNISVNFTHGGWVNPDSMMQRATLQRTSYFIKDGILIRRTWNVLDQHKTTLPFDRELLQGVKDFSITFLDEKKQWQIQWPKDKNARASLPLAVKIQFDLAGLGHFEQIYLTMGKSLALN